MRDASRYDHRVHQWLQEFESGVAVTPGRFVLVAEEAVHAAQLYRPSPCDALSLDAGFPGTLSHLMWGFPGRSLT
ncbi:hypothetical protein GCM10011577_22080 [Pseudarthrobacter polychromogenes]|uniref:Uncharacterized protein n=1 Tax=Pseudarthrobacter polychromogenes TaxID=1676 RepID=A0ABQ1XN91_9MICC|nr:hypothetical protein GCM10011577_22080 [Pseudarthrobacter polychromogenes]